jgi:hypothetical protein
MLIRQVKRRMSPLSTPDADISRLAMTIKKMPPRRIISYEFGVYKTLDIMLSVQPYFRQWKEFEQRKPRSLEHE